MTEQAIGLGLVLSLIFSEIFGLAAGGMVVPGYMALHLHEPQKFFGTVLVGFATYGLVRFLSNFMFIYGRRRTVITIMIAFALGSISRHYFVWTFHETQIELSAVGYIIPGLIAIWMERQGVTATICVKIITAVLIRLLLIVLTGGQL